MRSHTSPRTWQVLETSNESIICAMPRYPFYHSSQELLQEVQLTDLGSWQSCDHSPAVSRARLANWYLAVNQQASRPFKREMCPDTSSVTSSQDDFRSDMTGRGFSEKVSTIKRRLTGRTHTKSGRDWFGLTAT